MHFWFAFALSRLVSKKSSPKFLVHASHCFGGWLVGVCRRAVTPKTNDLAYETEKSQFNTVLCAQFALLNAARTNKLDLSFIHFGFSSSAWLWLWLPLRALWHWIHCRDDAISVVVKFSHLSGTARTSNACLSQTVFDLVLAAWTSTIFPPCPVTPPANGEMENCSAMLRNCVFLIEVMPSILEWTWFDLDVKRTKNHQATCISMVLVIWFTELISSHNYVPPSTLFRWCARLNRRHVPLYHLGDTWHESGWWI